MYLTNTTETLQVILSGAVATNESVVTVDYGENTSTTFVAGKQRSTTNGSTAVNILSAPSAASTQRIVQFLTMTNADTAAITATFRTNDGGTIGIQFGPVVLQPGERVEFATDVGFRVYNANGAQKTALSSPPTNTYFEASLTSTQTPVTASTFTTIVFNNEIIDTAGAYNPATGVWTVPDTGKYSISAFAHCAGFADGANVAVSVFIGSTEAMRLGEQLPSNPTANVNAGCQVGSSLVMRLTGGQQVTIRGLIGAAAASATLRFTGTAGGELTYLRAMRIE